MMWGYGIPGSGAFGGWWAAHMLVAVLFWVAFVAAVVWCAQRLARLHMNAREYRAQGDGILSAVTILQERYARGEIGREEFIVKQRDLVATAYRHEPADQMTELV
jgi:putative membrane protein